MTQVLIVGGVSFNTMIYVEAFPRPVPQTLFPKAFHETIGSTGAGKALNLSKLGMEVTFEGLIGDDDRGAKIRAYLDQPRLRFIPDVDPKGTQQHVNLMNDEGQRISIIIASGSPRPAIDTARIEDALVRADYVALNIENYCRYLIPLIVQHNKAIWCDIHDYDGRNPHHGDFIQAADYIFMSSDAMPDFRPFMADLIARGKRLVVCTHGRHGATALTEDGRWFEVPVVDTYVRQDSNGAGDAFFAGFVYGHARGYPVERCLEMATIVSGLCITSSELAHPELSAARVEAEYRRYYRSASPGICTASS